MNPEERTESLAWTSILTAFSQGLSRAFQESNYVRYTWYTPKSEKNCRLCKWLHGTEIREKDIPKIFPAHPYCCCFPVPKLGI